MKNKILASIIIIVAVIAFYIYWIQVERIKIFKIGVINYSPVAEKSISGLKSGLEKLGYIEGKSILYIYAGAIRDRKKLAQEGERLVELGVDLIYAMSTPATLVAKNVTQNNKIPVVFAPVSDPIKADIVTEFVNHKSNITGVTFGSQEPKRLEIFKKMIPNLQNIYVPYNPNNRSSVLGVNTLKLAAKKLGLTLILDEIYNQNEIDRKVKNFLEPVDAIFIPTDTTMIDNIEKFIKVSLEKKIPITTPERDSVKKGVLFSYGFSIFDIGNQASRLVDQILKGVSPQNLPIEQADSTIILNRKAIQVLKLKIPGEILRHAIIFDE